MSPREKPSAQGAVMRLGYLQVRTIDVGALVREALERLQLTPCESQPPNLCDLNVAVIELSSGCAVADEIPPWLRQTTVPRVGVAAASSERLVIDALRNGFRDYLSSPLSVEELANAIDRLGPASPDGSSRALGTIVGNSGSIRALREQIGKVAPVRANVLITGETGTGKELIAQSIHELSPRHRHPFVAVNCGALPEGLVESELFGHERGAFTGAVQPRSGLVTQSSRGTLFLDEVSELDPRAQVKLLRVLETRQVQPLGHTRAHILDLRIVAATNDDLTRRVASGTFREDLFHRLNVVRVDVAPLRNHREDVALLIEHFCACFAQEFSRRSNFRTSDLVLLQQYDWPGNVRELRNVVEAAFVHSTGRADGYLELPPVIARILHRDAPRDERQQLIEALFVTHWNVSRAAERLNCSRMTVYRKMAQYQLRRPSQTMTDAIP